MIPPVWQLVVFGLVAWFLGFLLGHSFGKYGERKRWAYADLRKEMEKIAAEEYAYKSNKAPVYHPLQFPFRRYEYGCDPAFTPKDFSDAVLKLVPNGNCSVCGKASYWNERDCEHMKAIAIHPCNKEGRSPEQFAEDMDKLFP